jgi:hypothetical protein
MSPLAYMKIALRAVAADSRLASVSVGTVLVHVSMRYSKQTRTTG